MAFSYRRIGVNRLHLFQTLDCGETHSGEVATGWAKCTTKEEKASRDIVERKTKVYAYFEDNDLIGFGSIGTIAQKSKKGDVPYLVIPHLGIDRKYHGLPKTNDPQERYSSRILADLIRKCTALRNRILARPTMLTQQCLAQVKPSILLWVDSDNTAAQKLYQRMGFAFASDIVTNGLRKMRLELDDVLCRVVLPCRHPVMSSALVSRPSTLSRVVCGRV